MRGGKDWTNSTMEPLFPRLHVKDTGKGGPKPPPRNKMAVYDELIAPSSKLTNESTTLLPLHPNGFGQIRYVGSSGKVVGPERRTLSALYGSRASTHTTSRMVPSSPSDKILSTISAAKPLGYVTSSIPGNSLMTTQYSSLQRSNFINFKRPSCNEGKVEVTLPSLARQGECLVLRTKQCGIDQEKMNSPGMNSSIQSQKTSGGNQLKRASVCDQDPEDQTKMTACSVQISSRESQGSSKKMALISTIGTKEPSHKSSKPLLSNGVSNSSKNASTFSSQQSNQTDERSTVPVEENNVTLKDSETRCVSLLRTESYSGSLIDDNNGGLGNNSQCTGESENESMQVGVVQKNGHALSTTEVDHSTSVIISPDDVVLKIGQENFWKTRQILVNQQRILSIQVFELHRLVQVQRSLARSSHHFMEETLSLREVSNKDDLVPPPPPPLPPWPITHAPLPPPLPPLPTQVPNECPKTIAADNSVVKIPFPPFFYDSAKGSLCGKTTASPMVMTNKQGTFFNPPLPPPPSPPIESNELSLTKAIAPGNSFGKHLYPPLSGNSNKHSLSGHQYYSKATFTSVGMDMDTKPLNHSLPTPPTRPQLIQASDPCPKSGTPLGDSLGKMLPTCFYPPPENQWLVPFMSPEGLVYKRYTGSCPPNAGFTAHVYGSCGPMNVPTGDGSYFLNAAYGIPDSQQGKGMVPGIPITLPYLAPCAFSTTNLPPQGGVEDRSSCLQCVSSHPKGECCCGMTVPGSNDVDRQGSTGSSSVERASQDTLPLFPLEPAAAQELEIAVPTLENGSNGKQTQAIKAVLRVGRLATESLMRIFQSIQEERRQTEMASLVRLQE